MLFSSFHFCKSPATYVNYILSYDRLGAEPFRLAFDVESGLCEHKCNNKVRMSMCAPYVSSGRPPVENSIASVEYAHSFIRYFCNGMASPLQAMKTYASREYPHIQALSPTIPLVHSVISIDFNLIIPFILNKRRHGKLWRRHYELSLGPSTQIVMNIVRSHCHDSMIFFF